MKNIILALIIVILTGCSYSFNMNSLPHLKSIYVSDIENNSDEALINEEIQQQLRDLFDSDGRLKLVTKKPDVSLNIIVLDYDEDYSKYDDNEVVTERKVSIDFSIEFFDNKKDELVYENKKLALVKNYSVTDNDSSLPKSEEEAVEELVEDLYEKIISNTLEKW